MKSYPKSSQASTAGRNDLKRRAASPGIAVKPKSMKAKCSMFTIESEDDDDEVINDSIVIDSDLDLKYSPVVMKSRAPAVEKYRAGAYDDSIVIDSDLDLKYSPIVKSRAPVVKHRASAYDDSIVIDSDDDLAFNPVLVKKARVSLSNNSKFIVDRDSDEEEIKRPSFYGTAKTTAKVKKGTTQKATKKSMFKVDGLSSDEDIEMIDADADVNKPFKKAAARKKRTPEEIEEDKLAKVEAKRIKDEEKVCNMYF
jgi:hypothetical protein